jgi:hypothetical protein
VNHAREQQGMGAEGKMRTSQRCNGLGRKGEETEKLRFQKDNAAGISGKWGDCHPVRLFHDDVMQLSILWSWLQE